MIYLCLVVPVVLWLLPAIYCHRMVRKLERKTDLLREFASHTAPYRAKVILIVAAWIPVHNWKLARGLHGLWNEVIRNMELERFEELRSR